jgi:RNA polymerase sigma-70 factor (ECF subfamily)
MSDSPDRTVQLLVRMNAGDAAARDELFRHVARRLEALARRMLGRFPGVQRWAQTDDVLSGAMMRLLRALEAVPPTTPREFFGLAGVQVRRELLDLARHFHRPGALHASQAGEVDDADHTHDPADLAQWCELHEQVRLLPDDERAVVDLVYYQGLSQPEAATLLGVGLRTVQRRWQSALLRLNDKLGGSWPGGGP